jgi:acetyltransferase-like isoleucine patch superfamily enzyme
VGEIISGSNGTELLAERGSAARTSLTRNCTTIARQIRKPVVEGCAAMIAGYHLLRYRLLGRAGLVTFQQASEAISGVPLALGYRVRERFYRRLLAACGPRLEMNYGATISEAATRIGADVWIGPFCYIDLVEIGDHVLLAPHACVLAGGRHHRFDRVDVPIRMQGNNPPQRVRIGYGSWIGANAVVMADVGEGAIVGAGAVVTRPVPDYAVVAGNPAHILRYRSGSTRSPDARREATGGAAQ